jgi:lysozyme family protein
MADWNTAFNWMMDNEDSPRACKQVPDAPPSGHPGPCYAISGINSGAWPDQFAAIATVAQAERAPFVQQFYHDHFWNNWFEQIAADDVCKRVFDFAVNGGTGEAVKCLQKAVNALNGNGSNGSKIDEDGCWGPNTLAAVNAADPDRLVTSFKAQRLAYYQDLVNRKPADAQYFENWKCRANL